MENRYQSKQEIFDEFERMKRDLERYESIMNYFLNTENGWIRGIPKLSERTDNRDNFNYLSEVIRDAKKISEQPLLFLDPEYVRKIREKIDDFERPMIDLERRLKKIGLFSSRRKIKC